MFNRSHNGCVAIESYQYVGKVDKIAAVRGHEVAADAHRLDIEGGRRYDIEERKALERSDFKRVIISLFCMSLPMLTFNIEAKA